MLNLSKKKKIHTQNDIFKLSSIMFHIRKRLSLHYHFKSEGKMVKQLAHLNQQLLEPQQPNDQSISQQSLNHHVQEHHDRSNNKDPHSKQHYISKKPPKLLCSRPDWHRTWWTSPYKQTLEWIVKHTTQLGRSNLWRDERGHRLCSKGERGQDT